MEIPKWHKRKKLRSNVQHHLHLVYCGDSSTENVPDRPIARNATKIRLINDSPESLDPLLAPTPTETHGEFYEDVIEPSVHYENDDVPDTSIKDRISSWVNTFNITTASTNALLHILKAYHPELPRDKRTLLGTQTSYDISSIGGGNYHHFGVKNSVLTQLQNADIVLFHVTETYIQLNIDGLPLFKSSPLQFWPILGRLITPYISKPFLIGLFLGKSKPHDPNEFLQPLIEESRLLQMECLICDTQARSYFKRIKATMVTIESKIFFPTDFRVVSYWVESMSL